MPSIIFPVQGDVKYGNDYGNPRSGGRTHEGIDIFAPEGTPLVAVRDGVITAAGDDGGKGGLRIWLDGTFYYAHLSKVSVHKGQRVKAGQVIGYVGTTGNAKGTSPHLHFGWAPAGDQSASGWANPYEMLRSLSVSPETPSGDAYASVAPMGPEFAAPQVPGGPPEILPPAAAALMPPGTGQTGSVTQAQRPPDLWRMLAAQPGADVETQEFADLAGSAY